MWLGSRRFAYGLDSVGGGKVKIKYCIYVGGSSFECTNGFIYVDPDLEDVTAHLWQNVAVEYAAIAIRLGHINYYVLLIAADSH